MKSVLRIRIYAVRIHNIGTGTIITIRLIITDPQHLYRYEDIL
jgi:hypothetical protein